MTVEERVREEMDARAREARAEAFTALEGAIERLTEAEAILIQKQTAEGVQQIVSEAEAKISAARGFLARALMVTGGE